MQEVEEQILSTTTSQNLVPQEKHDKRPREEKSPAVIEIGANEFLIYTTKLKINPKPVFMQDDEGHATIVSIGPHVSTRSENIFVGTRQEDIFLGSPSSLTSQDPPDST